MGMSSPDAIAENLAYFTWLTGDPESLNRCYAMYEKVSAEDLNKAATKYFDKMALTIATISPEATSPFAGGTPIDKPKL